jgi:hypothetical protein
VETAIDALEADLQPLVAAIRQLDANQASAGTSGQSDDGHQASLRLLAELEGLLADDDTRAGDLWCESAPDLEAALGPFASRLGEEIGNFQFDKALLTLRQALAERAQPPAAER